MEYVTQKCHDMKVVAKRIYNGDQYMKLIKIVINMLCNVNCLHITLIVINEMPIFIDKCDYSVYSKKNEVITHKTYLQFNQCHAYLFSSLSVT